MYTGDYTQESISKIERFVRKFSKNTGIYVCCLSASREVLIDFVCSDEERKVISEYIGDNLIDELYRRVVLDNLEDQVLDNTAADELKVAACAIRVNGRCKLVYIVGGLVNEPADEGNPLAVLKRKTTLEGLMESIDILREMTAEYQSVQAFAYRTEEEKRQSQDYVKDIAESLKRTNTLTDVLKLLNSENSFDKFAIEFLTLTSNYLDAKYSMIIRSLDRDTMDVLAQWTNGRGVDAYEKNGIQKKLPFLEGNKPVILSGSKGCNDTGVTEWDMLNVTALVAMPVFNRENNDMFIVYASVEENRSWSIEELQFLADIARVMQNSLERRIQKNSLASSYASLEEILEHVGCAIVVLDNDNGVIHFENRIMKKLFSKNSVNPDLEKILWERHETNTEIDFYDYTTGLYYEIHHNNISWVNGKKVRLYAIYDVTDKKNYQKRIEQQAYTDFLTGLFNRMCCERDLAKIIDEAKKSERSGALLYLDLDDFKHINDGLGHQYGDVLLKDISNGLRSIKGLEENCYRMGGDEFVIIVPPRVYDEFDRIIEDIKNVFIKPFFLKDGEYYCTMSMGMVVFPEEGDRVDELVQKADVAMYEAKKSGKNRVAKYVTGSTSDANKRLDMEKNMRDATSDDMDEFLVYYQPIIDIQKDGNPCVGAEALVRWDSKKMGFVSPADFIPLAEYLGLINPIGEHVLIEACKALKHWNDNGHPEYKVNVNLSVVQLMQNDVVERIAQIVEETGIDPHNLTLEVTESLAINDMGRMKKIMASIRNMGIRIALDDFGTGYSSLNHIREIPLDVIKVDRSFVQELAKDDYSRSFIKMVAELAGAIDVNICVEGIEEKDQYEILGDMNVTLVQGYFFDKPMKYSEFNNKYM